MPRPRGMLRGKGTAGGNELMHTLRCSRGRGQAEATMDLTSAGPVGLLMPHPVARENGIPPFPGGETQLGMRERATSHLLSPSLSHHQGWTPLGMLLHITALVFLVAFPKDTWPWTPQISVPGEHHLSYPHPDPLSTSCRCVGQSKKPGSALSSAPLY